MKKEEELLNSIENSINNVIQKLERIQPGNCMHLSINAATILGGIKSLYLTDLRKLLRK